VGHGEAFFDLVDGGVGHDGTVGADDGGRDLVAAVDAFHIRHCGRVFFDVDVGEGDLFTVELGLEAVASRSWWWSKWSAW
jgi:hypothetical protein